MKMKSHSHSKVSTMLNNSINVKQLIPIILPKIQQEYDQWDETLVDEYANGGICHLIADQISTILWSHNIENTTYSSNFEQHVYCIVKVIEGIFDIDIPPSIYETGAAFTWKKYQTLLLKQGT